MESIKKRISRNQQIKYGYYQLLDHLIGREKGHKLTENSRRKFYQKLFHTLKKEGKGKVLPIERRSNLSIEEFKNHYVKKGIPVVLDAAAKDWDCVKNWSFDYFKNLYGKDEIVVVDQHDMTAPYQRMTLADVINGIKNGSNQYYRFYPLLEKHPEHILDFDYKWLRERRNKLTVFEAFQVFIGGDKTLTNLHNANQCNLFTQVVGEKKWRLYHSFHTAIVDPLPVENVYRSAPLRKNNEPFNPFEADFEAPFALYEYIDSYEVHLKPGDVLWNPPFYWHAVQNIGESIGVGYRWLPPLYCYNISPFYSFLDTIAKNPPIWKAYKLYQQDINLIHMAQFGQLEKYKNEIAADQATSNRS